MDRAGGQARGTQTFHRRRKQGVLLFGIAFIFGGLAVRHRKMLEHTGDVQPRQGIAGCHAGQGGVQFGGGAHRKADASHAGVQLEVPLHPHPRRLRRRAEGVGVVEGKNRCSKVVFGQNRRLCRVGVAQDQNGPGDAPAAQLQTFRHTAYRKGRRPGGLQRAGHHRRAVAVGVRLDHRAHRPAHRLPNQLKIVPQSVQINLRPAMLFKHRYPTPFCARYAPASTRQCRCPARRAAFSGGRRGLCGSSVPQIPWWTAGWSRRPPGSGS